ncbi:hypothetical protein C0J52_15010 [Blattella germanica]|nr:hypothetical protein C0J52_15010 [Blattella germanica]
MSQTLHVRCLVCGEVLAYQREETSPLLVHLRSRHPTLNIGRLDPIPTDDPNCDCVKPREQLFRQGNLQGIKDPCEPVDRERDILRKLNQGRPCDPTDCLRQFQASNLGRPCDPPDCQRIFRERVMQGENPLQESETKRKPALKKVGCKPYCRVFDTSDKSYPK